MPIDQLQHVNIRCADLTRSRDFYVNLLGLVDGYRPPFASVGHWLYIGDLPAVHLVQRTGAGDAPTGGGAVHHIAFRGVGLDEMKARLTAHAVPYVEDVVPLDGSIQLFIHDPDGVQVELNFEPATE